MNRVDRAITEAALMKIPEAVTDEARALAMERLEAGMFRSWAAARDSAARTVAGRHKVMPGPIIVALGSGEPAP